MVTPPLVSDLPASWLRYIASVGLPFLKGYAGALAAQPDPPGRTDHFTALLSGAVDMAFSTTPKAVSLVREGRLRALAVTTRERLPFLPEVLTVAEEAFDGSDVNNWVAMWTPAATLAVVLDHLNVALTAALADRARRDRLLNRLGVLPTGGSRDDLGRFADEQRAGMGEVVCAENIRLK